MHIRSVATTMMAAVVLAGCVGVGEHAGAVRDAQQAGDRMTVGTVQREIRVGMTSSDVVAALGSPNMVTTDDKRRETWVYDKVATETAYSSDVGGVGVLFFGGYRAGSGAASTNQRTLTVIIKFDEASRVRDFSYRSSSF